MQLLVLGMHRSGTSMVARALNLMGCYFGAEGTHTGMNIENPKGFWERVDLRRANDALLTASGFDWDRISALSLEDLPESAVTRYRETCARIFLELDAHRPWFVKEPRLCLLLPLLRDLLERPAAIIVSRDPDEVAMSLEARNRIPQPVGVALWEAYVVHSLRASADLPRLFVRHHDLVTQPVETIRSLWGELVALGSDTLRKPSDAEIEAFIESDLYRQRRPTAAEGGERPSLPGNVSKLDAWLREAGARPSEPEELEISEAALDILQMYERLRSLEREVAGGQAEADDLQAAVDRAENRLDEIEQGIGLLSDALAAHESQLVEVRDSSRAELGRCFEEIEAWEPGLEHLSRRWHESLAANSFDHAAEESRRSAAALSELAKAHQKELARMARAMVQARKLCQATRSSWRWRAGDVLASNIQRLRGRRRPEKLSVDLAIETLERAETEIRRRKD